MEQVFRFKQFSVGQDRCAMKVGTDGVLLGAWAGISPAAVLDIGAGTGLISLMLAQRTDAGIIDAIEPDPMAFEQCVDNFENSPWADRLFCYHTGLEEFLEEAEERYDLIVTNPPFYSEKSSPLSSARERARQQHFLPFGLIICGVNILLTEDGIFSLILPVGEVSVFSELAMEGGLHLHRICKVRGQPASKIKRCLLEFRRDAPAKLIREGLVIELQRHRYSEEYIALTKEFYLKM